MGINERVKKHGYKGAELIRMSNEARMYRVLGEDGVFVVVTLGGTKFVREREYNYWKQRTYKLEWGKEEL